MRRVLLDSNALDPLLTRLDAFEALDQAVSSAKLEVLFTHITVDEIAATRDLEKRQWLLNLLVFLGRPIPTSGAVLDFSRLNFCRVMADDDDTFEPLRSGNIKHSRDALIAHTALNEACALITNEKRLAGRAREQGVEVLTTAELLAEFGFLFLCLAGSTVQGSPRAHRAWPSAWPSPSGPLGRQRLRVQGWVLKILSAQAVRKDLQVPLWVEGAARIMRGVPPRCR